RAAAAKIDEMVVFVSASETHNRANVNRPIAESLAGFAEVTAVAKDAGIAVHGAVATAFGCPFEGEVPPENVIAIVGRMAALGIREISLGDTTGMATPPVVSRLCTALRAAHPEIGI